MSFKRAGLLLGAFACVAATHPANQKQRVALEIIKHLDLTSFHNSVGPRREAGKKSFADYGFTRVRLTSTGAELIERDGGWGMGIEVLDASRSRLIICFTDYGIARMNDPVPPHYSAQSSLSIERPAQGRWRATWIRDGVKGCANNPSEQ